MSKAGNSSIWHGDKVKLQTTPGRTCIINKEEYLFFSGYSYLGMNHVSEFTELVKEGIDKYGSLFPSSRISNTQLELYEEFENDLSKLISMKETVSFSSGFLAGKTISEILASYQNILIAPHTHPAITQGIAVEEITKNFHDWSEKIIDTINLSDENEFVIICDAINNLSSEIHDLSFLEKINTDKKLIVLVDYSHAIGLNKQDIFSRLPQAGNIEFILCYSLSKALNIPGGAVSCSKYFADKLRRHPNYAGSTAINPSMMYAYLNSKDLYDLQRKKLFNNINYLMSKTSSLALLKNDFKLPVFLCYKENAEEHFYTNKIIISSFNYPYPSSLRIDRIVINALHTREDLDQLSSLL